MDRIDSIICEEIDKAIVNGGLLNESFLSNLYNFVNRITNRKSKNGDTNKEGKNKEDKKHSVGSKPKLKGKPKNNMKMRKTKNGGKTYYDYDEYERKHRKISKGDADSIRSTIDMNNTDIAAVARKLLPHHTKQGSQSQVRKILTGERPMTKDMAAKLNKMISSGQVAVK